MELLLVDDLPVGRSPSRVKQTLGDDPALLAYFLDNNVYVERPGFWLTGRARTFVPLVTSGRLDNRFLGAFIRITPVYERRQREAAERR